MLKQTLTNVDAKLHALSLEAAAGTSATATTAAASASAKASAKRAAGAGGDSARKVQKTSEAGPSAEHSKLRADWNAFAVSLKHFERQTHQVKTSFAFWFAEGSLVKALKEGHWLLLDEINLASSETLERLSSVLDAETGTLSLTERGDTEAIVRHPEFRLFACMNPPTDFGKKDLPPAIRYRPFSSLLASSHHFFDILFCV
jgi:midasin